MSVVRIPIGSPEPLTAEEEARFRALAEREPNFGPAAMSWIPGLLATIDAVRAALVRTPETLDARTCLALREAAQDVVIQEGRYYERDGSGESAFVAVVPKSALLRLRAALAASPAPDPGRAFAKGWPEYYGEPVPAPDPGAGEIARLRRIETAARDYFDTEWDLHFRRLDATGIALRAALVPSAEPPETT